jgi:hypothetical protein
VVAEVLFLSFFKTFVAAIVGWEITKKIRADERSAEPYRTGRNWLAWTILLCFIAAPNLSVKGTIGEKLAVVAVISPVACALAFLIGLAIGSIKKNARASRRASPSSVESDHLWVQAMHEFESKDRDEGLYARLYAKHGGDDRAIKSEYMTVRVRQLLGQTSQVGKSAEL